MYDRIERLSNIKAIGWTTLIISAIILYWITIQLIGALIFSLAPTTQFPEVDDQIATTMNTVYLWLVSGLILAIVTTVAAVGLIILRTWGLILFHSATTIIVISIIIWLGNYILSARYPKMQLSDTPSDIATYRYMQTIYSHMKLSYVIFFLLISFLIIKLNFLLTKKNYRSEFE